LQCRLSDTVNAKVT